MSPGVTGGKFKPSSSTGLVGMRISCVVSISVEHSGEAGGISSYAGSLLFQTVGACLTLHRSIILGGICPGLDWQAQRNLLSLCLYQRVGLV